MKISTEWLWGKIWGTWEKFLLRKDYDPGTYWNRRGLGFFFETYQRKLGWQHPWFVDRLQSVQWESLLEIGCGFGRNLKYLLEIYGGNKVLEGLEFSEPMIKKLHAELKGMTGKIHNFSISDPNLAEKLQKKYDVLLSHGLLMHIPFPMISQTFENIRQLTNKYFICIEETASESLEASSMINKFTFSHNYSDLLDQHGFIVKDRVFKNKLTALFCEKK